ncbi:MAG: hypothetical protein V2J25_07185 [Desulfatiglans sp.]|jgi:hypothetical protein|nr:hypothetical protein [Desulfatiglans sp.]
MKTMPCLLIPLFIILCPGDLPAFEFHRLQGKGLTVIFEPPLEALAIEVARTYPQVKEQLENRLGWTLKSKPSVLLFKDRKHKLWARKNPLIYAFAVPAKSLIVIYSSRMATSENALRNTLEHELCHLLLHSHINKTPLPRWLDEGVCQWLSDGPGEIVADQKRSLLNRVAVAGEYIRLKDLRKDFPTDTEALLLAYEQSKDIVRYMVRRFGQEGVKRLLGYMKQGKTVDDAAFKALFLRLDDLEKEWHDSLESRKTWYIYFSYYLYEILFALAALTTIYASIRLFIKKRNYMREETPFP